jgi:hypothetical protein
MDYVKKRELYDGTAFGLCNKKNKYFPLYVEQNSP